VCLGRAAKYRRAYSQIMFQKLTLLLVLLNATAAIAAPQNFLPGLAYSEQIGAGNMTYATSLTVATDSHALSAGSTATQQAVAPSVNVEWRTSR